MEIVEESIKQHDKYQFEVKFIYPVDKTLPFNEYQVETYFFLPENLDVKSDSYSKNDFYNDMQKYLRFKTPAVLLKSVTSGKDSPLEKLKNSIERFAADANNKDNETDYKYNLKMFCSIFRSALRDEEIFIEKLDNKEEYFQKIKAITENSQKIAKSFRNLKKQIHVPTIPEKFFALYLFADEYISLMLDKYRYRLLLHLKGIEVKNKRKLHQMILELLKEEVMYRESQKYPSVAKENSDNEILIYRMGILKKLMGSVLFLKSRTKTEGRVLEQITFGFAAGLAMFFATAVAFACKFTFEDLTLSFFVALVVSYIFKDRIKELVRIYLYRKIKKYIYDFRTVIYNSLDRKIGYCRENFTFIKEKHLPENIARFRNKDYITELENGYLGEQVIFYKKYIKIFTKECQSLFRDFPVDGINDIIRFNVRHFLDKMDNPEKKLFVFDEKNDTVNSVGASRVYHMNMVFKYGMVNNQEVYRRYRVILNQNGIKRIEEICHDKVLLNGVGKLA
jgi:hypothetical protein